MRSPIFDMPWDQLREYWNEMIVETDGSDPGGFRI
jgi:hypothetical protein